MKRVLICLLAILPSCLAAQLDTMAHYAGGSWAPALRYGLFCYGPDGYAQFDYFRTRQ
jgi:hypothetical protein